MPLTNEVWKGLTIFSKDSGRTFLVFFALVELLLKEYICQLKFSLVRIAVP